MAANLALVAVQAAVPAAEKALARVSPKTLARAKKIVAMATNSSPEKVNLSQVATAQGGAKAQLVAEAMVKAGMPASDFFQHIRITDDAERARMQEHFTNIERAALAESDEAARAVSHNSTPDTSLAVKMEADCQAIEDACKMLGLNVDALMRLKVCLDHLDLAKVANYKVLRKHGRVR